MKNEIIRKNNITGEWEHLVTNKNRTYWAQGIVGNTNLESKYNQVDVKPKDEDGTLLVYENVTYLQPTKILVIPNPFVSEIIPFNTINEEYVAKRVELDAKLAEELRLSNIVVEKVEFKNREIDERDIDDSTTLDEPDIVITNKDDKDDKFNNIAG